MSAAFPRGDPRPCGPDNFRLWEEKDPTSQDVTAIKIFINTFARQCEKYQLPGELILVDWNLVEGRPGLAGVLQLPAEAAYFILRCSPGPSIGFGTNFAFLRRSPGGGLHGRTDCHSCCRRRHIHSRRH